LSGDRYLGQSPTDQREILHDGTDVPDRDSPLLVAISFAGSPNAGSKKASSGPVLVSQIPIFAI